MAYGKRQRTAPGQQLQLLKQREPHTNNAHVPRLYFLPAVERNVLKTKRKKYFAILGHSAASGCSRPGVLCALENSHRR